MKYVVKRDCFGFKGGYWKEGQIVELNETEKPPHHFERVDGKVVAAAPEPVAEPRTFSEIQKADDAVEKPNTGFAHDPNRSKKNKRA